MFGFKGMSHGASNRIVILSGVELSS